MARNRTASADISDEDLEKLKAAAVSLQKDVMAVAQGTEFEDQVAGFFALFLDALSQKRKIGELRNSLLPIYHKISDIEGSGKIPEETGASLRKRIADFLKAVVAASGRQMYDHEAYKKKLEEREKRRYEQGRNGSAKLCRKAAQICSRLGRIRRIVETIS